MKSLLILGYCALVLFLTETLAFCDLLIKVKTQETFKGSGQVDDKKQQVFFVKCDEEIGRFYALAENRFILRQGDCAKPEGSKSVGLVEIPGTAADASSEREAVVQDARMVKALFSEAAEGDRILIVEDKKAIELQLMAPGGRLKQVTSFSSINRDALGLKFVRVGYGMIGGELVKVEGSFYVIKDASGKEHKVHFDDATKKTGDIKLGAHVEVDEKDGHAHSIKVMEMKK